MGRASTSLLGQLRELGPQTADKLTTLAPRSVRTALWVGAGSLVVLFATGVPLIWQYHPARRLLVQELHVLAALAFVLAGLVLVAATVWSRLKGVRTTVGWLAGIGALALAVLAGGAGQALAWNALALNRMASGDGFRGLSVGLDPDVRLIYADDLELTPDRYQTLMALHLVGLPLLVVLVVVRSARAGRKAGQVDTVT